MFLSKLWVTQIEILHFGIGIVSGEVADPDAAFFAFGVDFIEYMLTVVEVIKQILFIALQGNDMQIPHDLRLDNFESFGIQDDLVVFQFKKGNEVYQFGQFFGLRIQFQN